LKQIVTTSRASGIDVRLARVAPNVLSVLEADGAIDALGADHLHPNLDEAVAEATATSPASAPRRRNGPR
jgi:hypothetical protein